MNQVHDMTTPAHKHSHICLFGGSLRLIYFCSVTVPAGVWAVQPTTGQKPPPLSHHTFTMIDHHRAVMFGGYTGSSKVNDTYVLDMKTWVWIA